MESFAAAMLMLFIFFGGMAWGYGGGKSDVNKEWQTDCQKLGVHRIGDKVYECKERK